MGIFDKAGDLAREHHDKIEQGIEHAGNFADEKTGGKYADKVDQAQDFANERLDQFGGPDNGAGPDDIPPTTPVPNQ